MKEKDVQVIKNTVPILRKKGTEITKRFYELLFQNHPELLNIFNHANQKNGRQQTALAQAVLAAAEHIENLEAILPEVQKIAHKHRSLGVLPEQYPIVGCNLIQAMKDVLGPEMKPEVISAWRAAYDEIAAVFIRLEQEMYQKAEQKPGGWAGFKPFIVCKKVQESDVITSFYLKPKDGRPLPQFQPGQYVSVKLEVEGEKFTHIRQYSLSDWPGKKYYRISVKREDEYDPKGLVSNYLHDHVREGDTVSISVPAGDFVLQAESKKPIVFLSGGVGMTPLVSMLKAVAAKQPDRPATYIHAARNGRVHALKEEIADLERNHKNVRTLVCYEAPTPEDRMRGDYDKEGYIEREWLEHVVNDWQADFYFCGPVPFMQAMYDILKHQGVDDRQIHFEFFGPAHKLGASPVASGI